MWDFNSYRRHILITVIFPIHFSTSGPSPSSRCFICTNRCTIHREKLGHIKMFLLREQRVKKTPHRKSASLQNLSGGQLTTYIFQPFHYFFISGFQVHLPQTLFSPALSWAVRYQGWNTAMQLPYILANEIWGNWEVPCKCNLPQLLVVVAVETIFAKNKLNFKSFQATINLCPEVEIKQRKGDGGRRNGGVTDSSIKHT